jgi:hypothetical protein
LTSQQTGILGLAKRAVSELSIQCARLFLGFSERALMQLAQLNLQNIPQVFGDPHGSPFDAESVRTEAKGAHP